MPDSLTHVRVKAPGLAWYKRKHGFVPYWRASDKTFRPRTINLSRFADDPEQLARRCDQLHAEMLQWRFARTANLLDFDRTILSLSRAYQTHPQSPFQRLARSSRLIYLSCLPRIENKLGHRTVDDISGLDLKELHGEWSGSGRKLAASTICRKVLLAMISFGVEARLPGCAELATALRTSNRNLPGPRPRVHTVSAEQVVALREAAHQANRPACALAYALVFETTLRLWDVIGQWVDWREYGVSDVVDGKRKWFGLRWEDINADLVLHYVPSKTSMKTGLAVTFPLRMAPMVMEELERWPQEWRQGPVIVNATTGLPYSAARFDELWRCDRKAAGVSDKVWARDLRASGITEGRAAGVLTDDVAKVAGHSSTRTTSEVYDRAVLEAAKRFADARTLYRQRKDR